MPPKLAFRVLGQECTSIALHLEPSTVEHGVVAVRVPGGITLGWFDPQKGFVADCNPLFRDKGFPTMPGTDCFAHKNLGDI